MDFEKICMMFTMQEPFYGILLSSMQRKAIPEVGTIGVRRSGNVFMLGYNPAFIDKLPLDTVLSILKHECLHLAFNHFTIWEGEDKDDNEDMHRIRNVALDLEVNSYIDRNKVDKAAGGVFPEDFGWEKCAGGREYFKRLISNFQQQQQQNNAQNPQQPCNGGKGGQQQNPSGQSGSGQQNNDSGNSGQHNQPDQPNSPEQNNNTNNQGQSGSEPQTSDSGNPGSNSGQGLGSALKKFADSLNQFDDHSQWPDSNDTSTQEELTQLVDTLLNFAAEEVEKGCGTIPGELVGRIEQIRKKPKPVTDWKRYFRRHIGNEFSELIRKSKKRESRRFPDAAGNRHQRKSHILVAVDTSGSVSMPEYHEFFGQIRTLAEKATFHVVECDTQIVYEYDFKGKPAEVLHGGGGTNFYPPIQLFNENKKKYDALIYFTDGYARIPKETPKETLWVISSQGDHDKKKYQVNGASVVFIKPVNK